MFVFYHHKGMMIWISAGFQVSCYSASACWKHYSNVCSLIIPNCFLVGYLYFSDYLNMVFWFHILCLDGILFLFIYHDVIFSFRIFSPIESEHLNPSSICKIIKHHITYFNITFLFIPSNLSFCNFYHRHAEMEYFSSL